MQRRSVAITGIGIVGPTGIGRASFWRSIIEGIPAIGAISRFDTAGYSCRIAGEVRDLTFRDLVSPAKLRNAPLCSQFALAAAELALRDAGIDLEQYEPGARGVVLGTSLGGWHEAQQQFAILLEKGANRVNPFALSSAPNYAPAMEVAIALNARGTHATLSTGCCAGTQAVGYASDLIASGELECCLAGGTEAPISPLVVAGMTRTRELCCENDDPAHASRPFDRRHEGFVLSEGSAVLVLESSEGARRRGVPIYAELVAHSSSVDATDPFRVDQSAVAGAEGIRACLSRGQVTPAELDYVCANGNSSPHFDRKDTRVLKHALGEVAARLPVSSIKGILGHPFGAAGAFQISAAALAIANGLIPPTHHLEDPDPECDLDFVPGTARPASLRRVLVCSYGFGGINAYALLRRPNS